MVSQQLLHLVFGGRLKDPQSREFENIDELDIVGMFPNYAEALAAWRGKAQSTICLLYTSPSPRDEL